MSDEKSISERDSGDEYEVESVLDKRSVRGEIHYRIKWRGFQEEADNTWEPERNLNCPREIAEFERELERIKKGRPKRGRGGRIVGKDEGTGHESNGVNGEQHEVSFEGEGSVQGPEEEELETGSCHLSGFTKESHPLLNSVVLTNLFRMLTSKQLATCRLVSKTWEENSRSTWRSSTTLRFLYFNRKVTLQPKKKSNSHSKNTLKAFMSFWDQECSVKPYRQFDLIDWKFFERSVEKSKSPGSLKGQIDRFWNLMGVNMTSLTLAGCDFSGAAELRKVIFQSCPKLETLVLDNCSSPSETRSTALKSSTTVEYSEPVCGEQPKLRSLSVSYDTGRWKLPITPIELLSHFPGLTSLRISCRDTDDIGEVVKGWLQAIQAIRNHDGHKLALKQFEVEPHVLFSKDTQEYFNIIRGLNIFLKSVLIDLDDVTDAMLKDLILIHGTTLEKIIAGRKLPCGCGMPDVTGFYEFPYGIELENLKTLEMSDRFCQGLGFLQYTPNLEVLKIHGNGYFPSCEYEDLERSHIVSNTFRPELENVRLVKLKTLALHCKVNGDDLRRLRKWLPNVENLTMFLNDRIFAFICKQWSHLVHLHGIDCGLTDEGITGLSVTNGENECCVKIKSRIRLMKVLSCLKIREGSFRSRLTDVSAVHGFLQLPKLDTLYFGSRYNFGDRTKKLLCSKIQDCKLQTEPFHVRHFDCPSQMCCECGECE